MLVGQNLVEQKMKYRGTQGTSGLYLFGWTIGSTGLTKESAALNGIDANVTVIEDNYRPEFMPTTEKVLMEIVSEKVPIRFWVLNSYQSMISLNQPTPYQ